MLERRERYDAKLIKILQSACQVFAKEGYHHASVRDVASATGVSPAGLYYYFSSKEELLFLILDHCLANLVTWVEDALLGVSDPEKKIRLLVLNHLTFFDEHRNEMRVLARDWEALSGRFSKEVSHRQREYRALATEALGILKPEKTPREIKAATMALFGMLGWAYQWHSVDRDLPMEELAELYAGLFLRGFLSGSGPNVFVGGDADHETQAPPWRRRLRTDASVLFGPGF